MPNPQSDLQTLQANVLQAKTELRDAEAAVKRLSEKRGDYDKSIAAAETQLRTLEGKVNEAKEHFANAFQPLMHVDFTARVRRAGDPPEGVLRVQVEWPHEYALWSRRSRELANIRINYDDAKSRHAALVAERQKIVQDLQKYSSKNFYAQWRHAVSKQELEEFEKDRLPK